MGDRLLIQLLLTCVCLPVLQVMRMIGNMKCFLRGAFQHSPKNKTKTQKHKIIKTQPVTKQLQGFASITMLHHRRGPDGRARLILDVRSLSTSADSLGLTDRAAVCPDEAHSPQLPAGRAAKVETVCLPAT